MHELTKVVSTISATTRAVREGLGEGMEEREREVEKGGFRRKEEGGVKKE